MLLWSVVITDTLYLIGITYKICNIALGRSVPVYITVYIVYLIIKSLSFKIHRNMYGKFSLVSKQVKVHLSVLKFACSTCSSYNQDFIF